MQKSLKNFVKYVVLGALIANAMILAIGLVLSMMVSKEILTFDVVNWVALAVLFVSEMFGAFISCRQAKEKLIPTALCIAFVEIIILSLALFGCDEKSKIELSGFGLRVACTVIGAVTGAFLSVRKKRKHTK